MSLQEEIDSARAEIRTDGYPVSIGEWLSIYERNELDIDPEFQRFFRWTARQKSRLIESILLGIPIPQVFVAQRPDGIWDVVDGLQRLSTIFQFVGVLRNEDSERLDPLTLEGTTYLPSLEGLKWEDNSNPSQSLTQTQRLIIKRAKIDVSIILKESGESTKYELFQRLNTGGSQLSDQELRNSIIVMLNKDFYLWLKELSEVEAFQNSIGLTDRALEEQYDLELVLRFLVFRTIPSRRLVNLGDIGEFLTTRARELALDKTFDRDSEAEAFKKTFALLNDSLAGDAFHRYERSRERFVGGFLVSAYEAVAIGLGHGVKGSSFSADQIRQKVKGMWSEREFTQSSGSGVSGILQNSESNTLREGPLQAVKIHTIEQLSDALSEDLIWRKKELSSLKFALQGAAIGTSEHSALLRASLALLYAHWEGFVKCASRSYLEYLASQRLPYRELAPNFIALAARRLLNAADESNRIGVHIELTRFFLTELDKKSTIPYKDGISTRANLTSRVLREILATLGLDYVHFATKAVLIDERLVAGRNEVAHGEYLQVDQKAFTDLQEDIIVLLNLYRNLIENAVALRAYRAA